MSSIRYITIILAGLLIFASSCKKETVVEDDQISFEVDGQKYQAADIKSEIDENVLRITALNISGETVVFEISNEIRKGNHNFRNEGMPIMLFSNQNQNTYKSNSGGFNVESHDTDNKAIKASFSCTLKQEGGNTELEVSNGILVTRY